MVQSVLFLKEIRMEGVPKQERDVIDLEKGDDGVWREKAAQAPEQADDLIRGIEGYEQMSTPDRMAALKDLMERLSGSNDNRFVVKDLASRMRVLGRRKTDEDDGAELGIPVESTIDTRS